MYCLYCIVYCRKMVGMVLAIMRGCAPEGCLQLALDPDRDINTPMAPELGLFLVSCLSWGRGVCVGGGGGTG
jgi:tRNA U38,U39,U40 pseudouridine synthase TruA